MISNSGINPITVSIAPCAILIDDTGTVRCQMSFVIIVFQPFPLPPLSVFKISNHDDDHRWLVVPLPSHGWCSYRYQRYATIVVVVIVVVVVTSIFYFCLSLGIFKSRSIVARRSIVVVDYIACYTVVCVDELDAVDAVMSCRKLDSGTSSY